MKSLHHGTAAANAKLRGKLTHGLSCRCCELQNWKWRERLKEADLEIVRSKTEAEADAKRRTPAGPAGRSI